MVFKNKKRIIAVYLVASHTRVMDVDMALPDKEDSVMETVAPALAVHTAPDTVGLRYIIGRVSAKCRHTQAEIDAIGLVLLDVRLRFHLCKHDWLVGLRM